MLLLLLIMCRPYHITNCIMKMECQHGGKPIEQSYLILLIREQTSFGPKLGPFWTREQTAASSAPTPLPAHTDQKDG